LPDAPRSYLSKPIFQRSSRAARPPPPGRSFRHVKPTIAESRSECQELAGPGFRLGRVKSDFLVPRPPSRSDDTKVAVGFNPRFGVDPNTVVA
jgi:hypothetical protein